MLTKAKDSGLDSYLVMLEASNSPVGRFVAPAQLMCGQTLRSALPCKQEKLKLKQEQMIKATLNKDRRINSIKPSIMTDIHDH